MSSRAKSLIFCAVIWLVVLPVWTVWSIKYNAPQSVWFWCEMLHLCTP